MIMLRLNSDLSKLVLTKKVSFSGRQSMNGAQVTRGGLRRNCRNKKLRAVLLGATIVVMLASQAACLQWSIDPANRSVRIPRGRRLHMTTPEPGVMREFRDCGGNLTAFSQPAQLYSPGYPSTYDSEQECRWAITAVQGNVTLRFLHVQIEESPDCEFDSVDVLIGPSQESTGRLCGSMTNYTIATNTSSVTVVFRSDDNYEEKGFSLEFYAEIHSTGLAEECGNTLVGDEGNVTSPGYPLPYPHKSSCWTLINVEPGRVISVRFKDLTLEEDELCTFDYVEIFDGPSEDSPSFGRFCMESQQRTFRSSTSSVLVHFKSDDLTNSRGFLLEYKSDSAGAKVSHEGGCMVTLGFDNGTISSPSYPNKYPASADCLIDLEAPKEAKVALRFVEFSLEPDVECKFDFVEIWDGQLEGWRSLGRLCGDKGENAELMSSENRIRLKFHSDNSTESRGFVANFKLIFPQDRPEVEDGNNTIMRNRTLVPALKLMHEIPGNLTVAEDDEAFLNCIPKVPASSVAWFKDGMIINGTEPLPDLYVVPPSTLWIRRMHTNLTGSYTCRVIANYLKAESTSVVVMQGTKASDNCGIQFRKSPKDRELPQGETMVVQCAAQVSLQPTSVVTIAWLRNGLPFPTSSRYRDQSNGLAYVNDATPKDTAVYTCVATDRHSRCSVKRSALYRVLPRISVDEICGNPVVSRANTTRSPAQQGKIVGGEDTVKGAYPWQVMLWSPSLKRAFCGGTLLNDRWVLSAAHCFQHELVQPEEVQVRLGEHDRLEAEPEEVTTKIADIYFHPKFNASTYDNDIALLLLADRVKFTDYIQPACLGDRAAIEREEFNSTDGVRKGKVTGWGQLAENVHTLPRYLQEIELPIVNQHVCRNATTYKVTDNMFCAGYAQEIVGDACQGDSGGPFVVQRKSRWYIVGIVSWGVGCGRRGNYGYYTKVTNYHDWIREKIMY